MMSQQLGSYYEASLVEFSKALLWRLLPLSSDLESIIDNKPDKLMSAFCQNSQKGEKILSVLIIAHQFRVSTLQPRPSTSAIKSLLRFLWALNTVFQLRPLIAVLQSLSTWAEPLFTPFFNQHFGRHILATRNASLYRFLKSENINFE